MPEQTTGLIRVNIVMAEAGSAAAALPLADDPRLACRFWLGDAARQRHQGYAQSLETALPAALADADALLLSLTGMEIEGALVARARDVGLPSVQMLDVWGPYAHRLAGPLADRVAVIDAEAQADALADGVPAGRIAVTGQAAWELATDLPPAPACVVALLSQPIARLYGDRLGYTERDILALLEAVASARPDLVSDILVAPHPAGDLLTGDPRAAPLKEALARAGTVISAFSSAMVDALIGGRRVIAVQPDADDGDRCALSRHGLIPRATDIASLMTALPRRPAGADALRANLKGSARRLGDLLVEMTA